MLTRSDAESRMRWIASAPAQSRASLLEQQGRYLRQVMRHAYERVPFYRALFRESGIHPDQIQSIEDLRRVPITSRQQLQAASPASILAEGVDESSLLVERSSGASGQPIIVRHTRLERQLYLLFRGRTFLLTSPHFTRAPRITYVGLDTRPDELKQQPSPERFTVVECRQPLARIVEELVRSRPEILIGYPGVLAEIAQEGDPSMVQLIRPRLTVTSGEVLTPLVRELLSRTFEAPVTTTYASTEFFWMGGECAQTGALHLVDDSLVLEVVDDEGRPVAPGEVGDVVATSLHSFAQPFIRYRIGDVAVQGQAPMSGPRGCPCGRPFSTLGRVDGRSLDYLVLPNGSRIHSYSLSLPLRDNAPFLQRYQIVQESVDYLRIRIACSRPPELYETESLKRVLAGVVGTDMRIDLELADHLPREESGKFRVVVSKVSRHRS